MKIENIKNDEIEIISISGRLDATTASEAEQTIIPIINDGDAKVIIDLQNLEYISSAGLRILLLVAKNISAKNGKLCICSLTGNVKSVFEISGFLSVFAIENSEEDAITYLNS